jgi:ribonuclease P protein component
MRSSLEFARVKREGTVFRGRHCILIALAQPGEPTLVGFIASKKGVGNSVRRNRARRRLREIVRLRWTRLPEDGYLLVLIARGTTIRALHQDLAADVEHVLAAAGALAPIELPGS